MVSGRVIDGADWRTLTAIMQMELIDTSSYSGSDCAGVAMERFDAGKKALNYERKTGRTPYEKMKTKKINAH